MKFRRLIVMLMGFGGMGMVLLLSSASAQTKTYEFSYSIVFPTYYKPTVLAGEWAKEIEKRTNGQVEVTIYPMSGQPGAKVLLRLPDGRSKIYPGGTFTPADKFFDAVEKGISDIGMSGLSFPMGKFPLTEVIGLPLGYKTGVAATKLINEYYRKFKPNEFHSTKVMYFHAPGEGMLHTKRAVHKLEDLKGMKIRCTGMGAKVVTALGGIPVAMTRMETYDALNRGVVDGLMARQEVLRSWKFGEVVKFTTESFGTAYSTGFFVVMNKDKWNGLPSDIQKIIGEVNEERIEKSGKNWDEMEKEGRDFTLKLGNKIISLTPEENERWAIAVKPILDDYVKSMKARGLPGEEVLKFCLDLLKKLQ